MQVDVQERSNKNIYKNRNLKQRPCLSNKNLQNFEKVFQMHVEETKNKNFYYYWVPSKPPTITVKVCED